MSQPPREKALVICPGRGTYTAAELGYLKRFHPSGSEALTAVDQDRASHGLPTVTELDGAATYSPVLHTSYEHAPSLIHACALADFEAIDPERIEVVGITGNSMGWYLALAAARALLPSDAARLVRTMGCLTGGSSQGGQIIYPLVDDQWHPDEERIALLRQAMSEITREPGHELYDSIRLGGFLVIAGTNEGLRRLQSRLPLIEGRYPMRLLNHSAFHTPMMKDASHRGFESVAPDLFHPPRIPLIDGHGRIWQPYSTDPAALRHYTLGAQVTEPFDFTVALRVAIREFAPTRLILLGPGSNLGSAVGQTLVGMRWQGITSKADFVARQEQAPFLIAVGRPEQRALAIRGAERPLAETC